MLNLAAQNLVEIWAAITRPVDENGLGFNTEQATLEVSALKRLFVLLPEAPLIGSMGTSGGCIPCRGQEHPRYPAGGRDGGAWG